MLCCVFRFIFIYFVMCFLVFFSFIFISFQFLVHAMDTTPIVKTIQNNGNNCLFVLVYWLHTYSIYIYIQCYSIILLDLWHTRLINFLSVSFDRLCCFVFNNDVMNNVFHVSVSFLCVFFFSLSLFLSLSFHVHLFCLPLLIIFFSIQINELIIYFFF